jgi:hypothetical protein
MRLSQERGSAARRPRSRLAVERLEDRVTPSWGGVPPSLVAVPPSVVAVALNSGGDAIGSAGIATGEVDWYRFTTAAGGITIAARTPYSSLDTVIALYDAKGRRVAYNDDIASTNRDSRIITTLTAGTYYLGVTNYTGTPGGSYTWGINGPVASQTLAQLAPAGGFRITLRTSGLTAGQQTIFQQAANRWAQVITGDLPNVTYYGVAVDDVLIDASGVWIDGSGGILGQAGPDAVRSGSYLPVHGEMEFDRADLAAMEADGRLYYTVLHEMGHVLGIGTIWEDRGLLTGAGTTNPRFIGPQATAAFNALFGRSAPGVPVENGGGEGTRDSHWHEGAFGNEVMTGYLNSGANPLSRVTIASLADLGYTVNMNAANAYTPPGGTALVRGGTSGGGTAALRAPIPAPVWVGPDRTERAAPRSDSDTADPPARPAQERPARFEALVARAPGLPVAQTLAASVPMGGGLPAAVEYFRDLVIELV